jgi:predicted DNA-binding transcriptional regulator YafY
MADKKIERLMNLIAYLSDAKTPKTLREIIETVPGYADSVDAARRAFERDKEELRSMNFDIVLQENPNGDAAYFINKESTYYDVDLSAMQRNIMQYALEIYSPSSALAASALSKLGGMNPENEIQDVTSLPMPELIDDLYEACAQGDAVDITFRDTIRTVLPQKLIARQGYWYLETLDLGINEKRTFRADRISAITKSTRQQGSESSLHLADDDTDEHQQIVVRVHPHLRKQFCQTWNGEYNDATDEVSFQLMRNEIFLSQLFEYSGFVSVLSPSSLQTEIDNRFASAVAQLRGES